MGYFIPGHVGYRWMGAGQPWLFLPSPPFRVISDKIDKIHNMWVLPKQALFVSVFMFLVEANTLIWTPNSILLYQKCVFLYGKKQP